MSIKLSREDDSKHGLKQSDFSTYFSTSKDNGSNQNIKEDDQGTLQESFISNYETVSCWNQFKNKLTFSYGSFTLALIYMANTMVIPNMNQVQIDINFGSKESFIISFTIYFAQLISICLPILLAIKLCQKLNCPIFTDIVKKLTSPWLAKLFLYSNMIFNILSLFDFVVSLIFSFTQILPIQNIIDEYPIPYLAVLCTCGILIFYVFYKISNFEHFHNIQYRLVISLVCKWAIMWGIFIIVKIENSCENTNIKPDKKQFELKRTFFGVMYYCFFTFRCLSFPFLEVYHVKREVKNNYTNVKRAYQGQLILRSLFYFQQVLFWGLLYLLHKQDTLNCFFSLRVQIMMVILRLVCAISIVPIYAHNFSLNMTILNGTWLEASQEDNKKYIKQAFLIISSVFILITMSVLLLYMIDTKIYWDQPMMLVECITTSCFGFSCIAVPTYVYLRYQISCKNNTNQVQDWGSKIIFLAIICFFGLIFISPGMK